MVFSLFTGLYDDHRCPIPDHCPCPKRNPHWQSLPLPLRQPQAPTGYFLSLEICPLWTLPVNGTVLPGGLLCLSSCSPGHSDWRVCQCFIPFYGCRLFLCVWRVGSEECPRMRGHCREGGRECVRRDEGLPSLLAGEPGMSVCLASGSSTL